MNRVHIPLSKYGLFNEMRQLLRASVNDLKKGKKMTCSIAQNCRVRSAVVHGGRLTKLKGVVVSIAPMIGAGAAPAVLASAFALGFSGEAQPGACTETGGPGSGRWICSGPAGADVTQTPIAGRAGDTDVQTSAGFGISVAGGDAISVTNALSNANLAITDDNSSVIFGENDGIIARNYGAGTLSVSSTGNVVGTNGLGIGAYSYGSGLAISAANTTGAEYGIGAAHFGTGSLTVTSTGTAVGTAGPGIGAFTAPTATGLTVTAVDTVGADYGIGAAHFGQGAVTVTSTGRAEASGLDGIYAYSRGGYGTDVTVSAVDATGFRNGLRAYNSGSGTVSVSSSGTVVAADAAGIYANNSTTGTDLTITAMDVEGATSGIIAINNGSGVQRITLSGAVAGGSDFAINTQSLTGNLTEITLNNGATASSPAGLAISNYAGNSVIVVNTGASVAGEIRLNDGSDNLSFAGGNFSGVTIFDGGDDTEGADGYVDVLNFSKSTGTLDGTSVLNWERVEIDSGSSISLGSSALMAGTLSIMNGGVLDAVGGAPTVAGDVLNEGSITLANGAAGDTVTVTGNYSGSGALQLDVDFATGTSDLLDIGADVTGGTTLIGVTDVSSGLTTGRDVTIVDVAGETTVGDFALANGPVTSGIFDYDLANVGRQWALLGSLNATGAVYEALPLALNGFNRMPTYSQRVLQRLGTKDHPVWFRFSGKALNIKPHTSMSSLGFDADQWGLQAGADFALDTGATGQWIVGATLQYGRINAKVQNAAGTGTIAAKGYGIGATTTYFGDTGYYADFQGQMNWLKSDLSSSTSGDLAKGAASKVYSLSAELGKNFQLASGATLTPQAQFTWGVISGKSFIDLAGNAVAPGKNESLIGRLGLAFQSAPRQSAQFYVVGNVLHDFSGAQSSTVAGTTLSSRSFETWGEIGVGGSLDIASNQRLYGGVWHSKSLDSGGNRSLSISFGFSMEF